MVLSQLSFSNNSNLKSVYFIIKKLILLSFSLQIIKVKLITVNLSLYSRPTSFNMSTNHCLRPELRVYDQKFKIQLTREVRRGDWRVRSRVQFMSKKKDHLRDTLSTSLCTPWWSRLKGSPRDYICIENFPTLSYGRLLQLRKRRTDS